MKSTCTCSLLMEISSPTPYSCRLINTTKSFALSNLQTNRPNTAAQLTSSTPSIAKTHPLTPHRLEPISSSSLTASSPLRLITRHAIRANKKGPYSPLPVKCCALVGPFREEPQITLVDQYFDYRFAFILRQVEYRGLE